MTLSERNGREGGREIGTFLLVLCLLAASDLVRTGSADEPLTVSTVFMRYLIVLVAIACLYQKMRSKYGRGIALTDIAWIGLGLTISISACVHGDVGGVVVGLWTSIAVPSVFGRVLPCVLGERGVHLIPFALSSAGFLYIIYSLIYYPITFPFMGVAGNPNGMGLLASGMTTGLMALLVATRNRKQALVRLSLCLGILIGAAVVLASGSRTSCLAVLTGATISAAGCFKSLIRKPLRLVGVAVAAGTGALILKPMLEDWAAAIAAVFALKFSNSSQLSGRDEIWAKVWNDVTLLGHGRNYFDNDIGISGHNSTIEMLGDYGLLAGFCVVTVAALSIYSTFRYYWANRSKQTHALTPLLLTLCFWILSCGEVMLGPLGGAMNIAALIAVGLANYLPGHAARLCFSRHSNEIPTQDCSGATSPCVS